MITKGIENQEECECQYWTAKYAKNKEEDIKWQCNRGKARMCTYEIQDINRQD